MNMNQENQQTMELSPEKMSEREQRRTEIEQTFDYDGYQVARRELFAHLRDPAIVIRKESVTFNTACIAGLEDVVYVNIMFNSTLKRLVVKGCNENDKDALRWCVAKPDKRKSKQMFAIQACGMDAEGANRVPKKNQADRYEIKSKNLVRLIYQSCGWDRTRSYRLPGVEYPQQRLVNYDLCHAIPIFEGKIDKENESTQEQAQTASGAESI